MDSIYQFLFDELKLSTNASERDCREVATRISQEVHRICTESQRIQASGDVESWAMDLAKHRLNQCLHYYKLGSRRGRVELHGTLSAIVYRYITPPQTQSSYQARIGLIEDFMQGFYVESLTAFRRETQEGPTYQPKTLLQLSEYMAFTERFGKRRIPLPGRRNQQLIILRAQTFSQQQPSETLVDIERASDGASSDSDNQWDVAFMQQLREQMVAQDGGETSGEDSLRETVINELISYLEEQKQDACVQYFVLRLQDLPANEIEAILGLTARQRDYLQQRFKYHMARFAFLHRWELVHQWLEADLDRNFGLTPQQWQTFQDKLDPMPLKLLSLKQQKLDDSAIAHAIGITATQVQKQWSKVLELSWKIRNGLENS